MEFSIYSLIFCDYFLLKGRCFIIQAFIQQISVRYQWIGYVWTQLGKGGFHKERKPLHLPELYFVGERSKLATLRQMDRH